MSKEPAANRMLLKTKHSIPDLNKQLLPRRAAGRRLEDALSRRLTVVTAPAGYGKTAAVLKWLETAKPPCSWLSIDTDDNDPIVFWRYFCAALDSVAAGVSRDTEYVFADRELFKANVHISILIDCLSKLDSDFLLVLDDLHLIASSAVLDGLAYFIAYMPSNMHLVLVSRAEPRLKLTRLALKEDMVKIGPKELRFETEEIYQYYKARGYLLKHEEIQRIESYTEGWAAALVAVALSLKDEKRRDSIISSFGSCGQHIENYLAEDVFHAWTEEQRDFMEKTSVLDRLCAPLCEAVTGYDAGRLLKELYDNDSFLISLDDDGTWFRYHHLFSEFLVKKLNKSQSAVIEGLHYKAGKWFEANGFFNEAIGRFLTAKHYEEAVALIEEHGRYLMRKGEYSSVLSWLERLPDHYIHNSFRIINFKTVYYAEAGDFVKAWECVERAGLLIENETVLYKPCYIEFLLAKAYLFFSQGDIIKLQSTVKEAASHSVFDNTQKSYLDLNLYDISLYRTSAQATMKALRQNPEAYRSFVRNYRSIIGTKPGYATLLQGEPYYESGKLDEALPNLVVSVDEAVNAKCPGAFVPAMVTMAKISRANGDIRGALEIVEKCERRVAEFHKPHWGYMLKAFKVRLYIDRKDTGMVDQWMAENRLSFNQDNIRIHEYELISLSRALIYKKRYHNAGMLLTRLLSFAEELKRNHSAVEISNLLAITAFKSRNEEAALKHLERALSIGLEEGYVRSFLDEFPVIASLLELYILKHKKEEKLARYARELLARAKDVAALSTSTAGPDLPENLFTPAEKKVVGLMVDAYDNREIADKLGITIRTVKAHTGNIYKKLGVKTRVQCINKVSGTFM
jgi:LuxR family maltose regulon positive regulatory protein